MKIYEAWQDLQAWLSEVASEEREDGFVSPSAASEVLEWMEQLEQIHE